MKRIDKMLMAFFIYCSCGVLGIPAAAWAATYYVDFEGGDDGAGGTSTTSPWKHSPGDAEATGAAASAELEPGDTVGFKGGVVYSGHISVRWSGEAGRVITFRTDESWGTGRAVIDGAAYSCSDDQTICNAFLVRGFSYVRIRGFEIRGFVGPEGVWWDGVGITLMDDCHFIEISDNSIHDMGRWDNLGDPGGGGIGILTWSETTNTDIDIFGNEITKTGGVGIGAESASNLEIHDNVIHDYINWGIDISAWSHAVSNVGIHNNVIHDLYQYDNQGPHQDFVFIRDRGSDDGVKMGMSNILVDGNLFYNTPEFTDNGGTAMTYLTDGAADVTIRNNVYINPHSYYTVSINAPWNGTVQVYNNTIDGPLRMDGSGVVIKNNILAALTINQPDGLSSSELDYNLYVGGVYADHDVAALLDPSTGSLSEAYTLADWQAYGGYNFDAHSLFTMDARLVDEASLDCHLLPDSPAVDTGTTLDSFSIDKDGIPRPQGAAWDIGAYEYNPGGVEPVEEEPAGETPADASVDAAADAPPDSSRDAGGEEPEGGAGCGCSLVIA
jgi:hypothetical protein